ncbi:GNAT family N-acetyltransferase [Streptococcus mutans]|nr:GNAT family N-acetyltransferase [Streptococcus mutans]MCB4997653.1 GNAT family N-acetyltransferase [Streptococcus mutans]MCB5064231.1 GNAT family N-acetyltransferase [Streptococcus mutans]MCB5119387.1 GNAT family N-acetyltransferase [Streptococcus mutans]MCB5131964.1 GNAT family N-acetyltransferase [Streptococcus mutans]
MAVKEPLTIREYRPEDLEALLPLYEQLGYPTRTDELRDRLAGLLSHEDYHLLVAECDGQLVAFIGYARMYFFEKALSEGAKALVLNSGMVPRRKGAHTFYETYGFEKASYGFAFDLS